MESQARGEISALWLIDTPSPTQFVFKQMFFIKQANSATRTTIDAQAIAELGIWLNSQNIDLTTLRGQCHSHHSFNTFWSPTDEQMVEACGAFSDWYVFFETNKAGSLIGRLDVFRPYRLTVYDVPVEVVEDEADIKWAKALIEANVTWEQDVPTMDLRGGSPVNQGALFLEQDPTSWDFDDSPEADADENQDEQEVMRFRLLELEAKQNPTQDERREKDFIHRRLAILQAV